MGSETDTKLSILVLNQTWFVDELRAMGHRVLSAGWQKNGVDILFDTQTPGVMLEDLLSVLPRTFTPDRIVYHDDSGPISVIGLERSHIPSVFYSVDAHHHSLWHECFGAAFSHVFVAQKDYLSNFERFGVNVSWLPLWAPVSIEPSLEKTCDVSFRGSVNVKNHPKRAAFFKRLSQLLDVNVDAGEGVYANIYPKSKIVVNQAVKSDLNFRVFEAMMCGALLLTPNTGNGLTELFEPGVDLVTYENENPEDAASKIKHYLANETQRLQIASSGREKVLNFHTKDKRARTLEGVLLSLGAENSHHRLYGTGSAYLFAARSAKKISAHIAIDYIRAAANCLIDSAESENIRSEGFSNAAHLSKYLMEDLGCNNEAMDFILRIYRSHTNESSFAISAVSSLLAHNLREEALAIARVVSHDPLEFLKQAPEIEKTLYENIARLLARA